MTSDDDDRHAAPEDAPIASRDNALLRRARAARDGRGGRERDLILIEGLRLCEEAARARLSLDVVLYTEEMRRSERGAQLLSSLRRAGARRMHVVSETLLASVSDTTTPQGIVVLAERPRTDGDAFAAKLAGEALPLLVILHGISNPANAGSVLRAAEAAGACGAVAVKNTADLFSPKALRGAMGSSLRLPIWMSPAFADVVAWCNRRELRVICSDTRARQTYTEFDWRVSAALVVGDEGSGLDADALRLADAIISIPMRAPVESLNVAVACGILLYEAARQRALSK